MVNRRPPRASCTQRRPARTKAPPLFTAPFVGRSGPRSSGKHSRPSRSRTTRGAPAEFAPTAAGPEAASPTERDQDRPVDGTRVWGEIYQRLSRRLGSFRKARFALLGLTPGGVLPGSYAATKMQPHTEVRELKISHSCNNDRAERPSRRGPISSQEFRKRGGEPDACPMPRDPGLPGRIGKSNCKRDTRRLACYDRWTFEAGSSPHRVIPRIMSRRASISRV